MEYELYHHGVKGMKWGVRKKNYKSTGIRSALARRSNDKVDAGFKSWQENAQKRDIAIDLGKKATKAKMAYESNKADKTLKADYNAANKEYKKALAANTTYRKGVVRQEVGRDASRKYLSEAKKVKKRLDNDPSNNDLKKQYNELMSKHDVERAKARRAVDVSKRRMNVVANAKRTMTKSLKVAAGTAAVAAGAYAANKYLESHNVTLNGKRITLKAANIRDVADAAKRVKSLFGLVY